MVTNFFLGANTGEGFQSLYSAFAAPEGIRDMLVLKGGPGVGKSSFMKMIGKKAEEHGEEVEYIWCSGDPDSLDAVRLSRLGVIAVDGTAPHVIEPVLPAAVDRYVNLGCCYDVDRLKGLRRPIEEQMGAYKSAYRQAYRALRSEQEVRDALRELLLPGYDREKLQKRAKGIIRRELSRRGSGTGAVTRRFLGALTCRGEICRYDTIAALADRVYLICDSIGIGAELLCTLFAAATERGYDVVACMDHLRPAQLRHLIIPELHLAFLTEGEGTSYPGRPYRRLHADALLEKSWRKEHRSKCRFYRRTAALLREEALDALNRAKTHHDLLEQLYNPYVDFDRVYAMAEEEWKRIERQMEKT